MAQLARKRKIRITTVGRAQLEWNKMSLVEKRIIMRGWCKASTEQTYIAEKLPWYSLSHWMRMGIKFYFRKYAKRDGPYHRTGQGGK